MLPMPTNSLLTGMGKSLLYEIPVYNADNPRNQKFSGRRIKRGLYRTKDKHFVSADINGSANILVKSKHRFSFERVSSGFLANPLRMQIS